MTDTPPLREPDEEPVEPDPAENPPEQVEDNGQPAEPVEPDHSDAT